MNYNVKLSDEVREALALGRPVIALESTIIAHGMPYPQNVKTALACERLARSTARFPQRLRSSEVSFARALPRNR